MCVDAQGHVWITLRHPWGDGPTHLRVDPVTFPARLAVLIPRPRINLVLYYGLLAARAPWRAAVVASAGSAWSETTAVGPVEDDGEDGAGVGSRPATAHLRCRRGGRGLIRALPSTPFRRQRPNAD